MLLFPAAEEYPAARSAMIALRFLHTVLGWLWIAADTMVSATLIGIFGESDRSERVLRSWGRSSCASPGRA